MLQTQNGLENLDCQNQNPESKLYIMRNEKKRGFWCGILIEDTYKNVICRIFLIKNAIKKGFFFISIKCRRLQILVNSRLAVFLSHHEKI